MHINLLTRLRTMRRSLASARDAERQGKVLIAVPKYMAADIQQIIFIKQIDHSAKKWSDAEWEISLDLWRKAVKDKGIMGDNTTAPTWQEPNDPRDI